MLLGRRPVHARATNRAAVYRRRHWLAEFAVLLVLVAVVVDRPGPLVLEQIDGKVAAFGWRRGLALRLVSGVPAHVVAALAQFGQNRSRVAHVHRIKLVWWFRCHG